ncbi:MAG: DUF2130 domain-containing protein [Candidatus Aminicenantes bacterium]|nr:DUF2130 domain-containing protein [Candidatus Aminicenantes bacterium]
MDQIQEKVTCPQCGAEIDVNQILYHRLEEKAKRESNAELAQQKKAIEEREDQIKIRLEQFESEKESLQKEIDAGVKTELKKQTEEIQRLAKIEAEEEQSERIKSLEDSLKEKSDQVKELNKTKAEIEKLKREKDELRDAIEAENETKLNEVLKQEKERIHKDAENRNEMKLSEKDKIISDLNKKLQDAQRQAEQGSSQRQGEVQELAIEQWLQSAYPLDTIEEVKKGAQGADCLQIVNTRNHAGCGSIYYESKRTKAFQPAWIEKFKTDIREKRADIGVLVTEAMPADMERMGPVEGLWVCSFDEFKGLSAVLRQTIVLLHEASASQQNKGTKMDMLYNFLTGTEFRQQVEAIVEGFTTMKNDLETEKRAMQSQWKKREKQIEKVLINTTNMYSSIKGIAGSAVQDVGLLEFAPDEDEEEIDVPPKPEEDEQ